jgi:hypothetical protein
LSVRLRTGQRSPWPSITPCEGNPQVAVKIDDAIHLTAAVPPSGSYSEPLADLRGVGPGPHTITVGLVNSRNSSLLPCDRWLYVDKLTIVASTVFSAASYRNAPLAPDAALDADQSYAAALSSQVAEFGTWVNTTAWSAPIYVVPADQPRVNIASEGSPELWNDFLRVPLPQNAVQAGPQDGYDERDPLAQRLHLGPWADRSLILYQPATDTIWEFLHLVRNGGTWRAVDGGKITDASENRGTYDAWGTGRPHGLTGSGIPDILGMQTIEELQRGRIDHVVSLIVPRVALASMRAPATRTDGRSAAPDAIPEGTRFRLPSTLDVDALGLNPYATMVAKAVQRYGMVVVDHSCHVDRDCRALKSVVAFYAEDPRPVPGGSTPNPYDAIFGGPTTKQLLATFPWDRLQVLPPLQP